MAKKKQRSIWNSDETVKISQITYPDGSVHRVTRAKKVFINIANVDAVKRKLRMGACKFTQVYHSLELTVNPKMKNEFYRKVSVLADDCTLLHFRLKDYDVDEKGRLVVVYELVPTKTKITKHYGKKS